jgi:hypothetical protein
LEDPPRHSNGGDYWQVEDADGLLREWAARYLKRPVESVRVYHASATGPYSDITPGDPSFWNVYADVIGEGSVLLGCDLPTVIAGMAQVHADLLAVEGET